MQELPPDQAVIPRELLEAYSHGKITRRDIAEKLDEPVGFGRLLAGLHGAGLPLPRFPVDHDSPGVRLIRQLVERTGQRG